MNMYRCKFQLTNYENLESNIFVRADSKETAEAYTKKVFENTLINNGISNTPYVQIVTLSSDQEAEEYTKFMKKRNNSDRNLN